MQIPPQLEPLITQATDAALLWARLDAGFGLVGGFIFLALAVGLGFLANRMWEKGDSLIQSDTEGDASVTVFLVTVAASGILALAALVHLLNPWRWVGVFEPAVWIVHQAASAL